MRNYILALDEGTTSARSILFDHDCNIVSSSQHEFTQYYPQPGWVEQNPMEIYANQYATLTECIAKSGISPEEIAGIGITNQRETTILWNKITGKPIYNAIVWQCRRTADICDTLIENGYAEFIQNVTGLKIDAYFSATKIKWILDNVEGAREMAARGELLFGTVDTWLIWKLTEGRIHVTDVTNASRTMLFNIEKGIWDDKLLEILDIPKSILPKVCSSSEIYGNVEIMGASIPICGIAGDQQAALFGQCCFENGEAKNTYGTGCFLLAHTGNKPISSKNGLITTVAATEQGRPLEYALEGSVFVGGAVIQWLRDELRVINSSDESEYLALKVDDSAGVYLVPAFAGLGAPHWDMHARGTITGLTRGTNIYHIIRAALESIAYQSNDVLSAMEADRGIKLSSLKVDGGASANDFLMQFQSDISNLKVIRLNTIEATSQGAAFLAGLAVGFFKNRDELKKIIKSKESFLPAIDNDKRCVLLDGWHQAIEGCKKQ
ncbi:MAG: glycerol kinase GlpK [Clostridia bacterium]|nr:glycerol kinase GlpK [Clostridia bacterium]